MLADGRFIHRRLAGGVPYRKFWLANRNRLQIIWFVLAFDSISRHGDVNPAKTTRRCTSVGATMGQRFLNLLVVLVLLDNFTWLGYLMDSFSVNGSLPSRHKTLNQCWFNVGPPSARRWTNVKPTLIQRLGSAGWLRDAIPCIHEGWSKSGRRSVDTVPGLSSRDMQKRPSQRGS